MAEPKSHEIESHKLVLDYLKHLTTLSTGSIVLLVAFLEKIFLQPRWKFLVIISISAFAVSVLASVIVHTIFVTHNPGIRDFGEGLGNVGGIAMIIGWIAFLIGIAALSSFAVRNFF